MASRRAIARRSGPAAVAARRDREPARTAQRPRTDHAHRRAQISGPARAMTSRPRRSPRPRPRPQGRARSRSRPSSTMQPAWSQAMPRTAPPRLRRGNGSAVAEAAQPGIAHQPVAPPLDQRLVAVGGADRGHAQRGVDQQVGRPAGEHEHERRGAGHQAEPAPGPLPERQPQPAERRAEPGPLPGHCGTRIEAPGRPATKRAVPARPRSPAPSPGTPALQAQRHQQQADHAGRHDQEAWSAARRRGWPARRRSGWSGSGTPRTAWWRRWRPAS